MNFLQSRGRVAIVTLKKKEIKWMVGDFESHTQECSQRWGTSLQAHTVVTVSGGSSAYRSKEEEIFTLHEGG